MFVPTNKEDFYEPLSRNALQQCDIITAQGIGLKEEGNIYSPDFWMIVSKDCDLVFDATTFSIRRSSSIFSLIPLLSFSLVKNIIIKRKKPFIELLGLNNINNRIVLIAAHKLFDIFLKHQKKNDIDNLIRDRLSKFMLIPPDGTVFTQPMLLDFELIQNLDATDPEVVKSVVAAKSLQLKSPYRQKIIQRFGQHFTSIGVNDDFIRTSEYIRNIKDNIE